MLLLSQGNIPIVTGIIFFFLFKRSFPVLMKLLTVWESGIQHRRNKNIKSNFSKTKSNSNSRELFHIYFHHLGNLRGCYLINYKKSTHSQLKRFHLGSYSLFLFMYWLVVSHFLFFKVLVFFFPNRKKKVINSMLQLRL